MKAAKKWVPAFTEAGLEAVLERLAIGGGTVKFGETGKEKEVAPFDALSGFLEGLPEIVPTHELAGGKQRTRGAKGVLAFTETKHLTVDPESEELRQRAIEIFDKANPKISFGEALKIARREAAAGNAGAAGSIAAGAV